LKLWRLTRAAHVALDGSGPEQHGARYSSPGRRVINFASEAGLAVLVAQRYLPDTRAEWPQDFVLGWTEVEATPECIPDSEDEGTIRAWVDQWLDSKRSLLASIPSRVLPEGDIVMMNPHHPDFASVARLTTRPFRFEDCLHRPPMLATYRSQE